MTSGVTSGVTGAPLPLADLAPSRVTRVRTRHGVSWAVPGAAIGVVLLRLPFATLPPGADEAGFLQVGAQWVPGGGSLYGRYWVDRPPLLVTLYRLAALSGGVVPLRLLGCAAAAAVVLLVAWSAQQLGGRRAAAWSAVAAAALLASPLVDALEVNGELLAAPFVALGTGACLAAARTSSRAGATGWVLLAGAAGTAAVLVKQNELDVVVLGAVLALVHLLRRRPAREVVRRAVGLAAAGAAGAVLVLALTAAWTVSHGTSVPDVLWAMYPFRLRAAATVAASGSQHATARLPGLAAAWVLSGLAPLTACLVALVVRARLREPVLLALAATAAFDVVSVVLGGSYWLHYLVQAVVPVAVAGGLAATRPGVGLAGRVARAAVGLAVASTLTCLAFTGLHPPRPVGQDVGTAVRAVAEPGDTLTTLYGEAQVNLASGLPSPYEHLWSLPVKTLDPELHALDAVLTGPDAPTWLVTARQVSSWGLDSAATQRIVAARYRPVAVVEHQRVYLRDGIDRAVPGLRPSAAR